MTKRDQILQTLRTQPRMTAQQVGDALGITRTAALYHLGRLVQEGKAHNLGRGHAGGFAANNTRLRGSETDEKILDRLARSHSPSMTAAEIAGDIGVSTAAVAKRLYLLKQQGKVLSERNGELRGYRLADWSVLLDNAHAEEFLKDRSDITAETAEFFEEDEPVERIKRAFKEGRTVEISEDAKTREVEDLPKLQRLFDKETPFAGSRPVEVPVDMFDKVKGLPFPVGVAALALLNNDVTTAKRMLELT